MATIEELLKSMLTLKTTSGESDFTRNLENNAETWKRIGQSDNFSEFNFESESEKEQFLSDWCANNEYSNIV